MKFDLFWWRFSIERIVAPISIAPKKLQQLSKKKVKLGKLQRCFVCDKTMYTEELGKYEAERIGKKTGNKLRAYKCQFCETWHLTHLKNKLTFH